MASRPRLLALAVAVALAAVAVGVAAPHTPGGLSSLAAALGPAAPAGLLAAWIALTPALFPGTVLAAAGGLLLGPAAGIALGGSPRVAAYALLGGSLAHPTSGPALVAFVVLAVVSAAAVALGWTARRALASAG